MKGAWMHDATAGSEPFEEFLRLLGVSRREPGLSALTELVEAHLTRVPFENLSKLHRLRRSGLRGIPSLPVHLEGIRQHHFGGTCYANNYHLYRLLEHLGYQVALCGANMARPDVHLVNLVTVEGREYLVDAGYGAPFLAPMPRDLAHDHEIRLGRDRYRLRPRDPDGNSRVDLFRDGRLTHGYLVKPAPRTIEAFATVIEESFSAAATFMNSLVIARFSETGSVVLHNRTLVESDGTMSRVQRLAPAARLPEVITERFGIPVQVASEALEGVVLTQDAWG